MGIQISVIGSFIPLPDRVVLKNRKWEIGRRKTENAEKTEGVGTWSLVISYWKLGNLTLGIWNLMLEIWDFQHPNHIYASGLTNSTASSLLLMPSLP